MLAPIIVQIVLPSDSSAMLTVPKVAELLSCTHTHVTHLIEGRKLVAFNFASDARKHALYRVSIAAFEQFMRENVVT